MAETIDAAKKGVDEVDMVINVGAAKAGVRLMVIQPCNSKGENTGVPIGFMEFMKQIKERAAKKNCLIVLPESYDERVTSAAAMTAEQGKQCCRQCQCADIPRLKQREHRI